MVSDAAYRPRNPEESLLYQVVAGELETFLAAQEDNERQVPGFIEKEFRSFLDCGVLARGFSYASVYTRGYFTTGCNTRGLSLR